MGFECQSKFSFSSLTHFSSRNHTDSSSSPIEQNPPNSPQQDSPIPYMPHKQTLWKHTPGLSGIQWSEDLFQVKQQAIIFLIFTFESIGLTLPPFVETPKHNEPPIPGLSQASDSQLPSNEYNSTLEPEPEVALTQAMKDSFAGSATPCSMIIIDDTPIGALIPTMRLCRNSLTCNQLSIFLKKLSTKK
ncbi:hypothetical protein O181_020946 [Austropuccinia psidii MF-1]|uniref:Uncharacterized protein n=1 Tax=Austropuccinia psidii MF-1 TaxID=1389203 RepID=A0A9Q3CA13_9BASI|nr:hypothetical protein [Austropuccinia psidii MF-1]